MASNFSTEENPLKRYKQSPMFQPLPWTDTPIPPTFSLPIIRPTMFGIPDLIWEKRWDEGQRQRWIKMHHIRQRAIATAIQAHLPINIEELNSKHSEFVKNVCEMYMNEFDEIDNFK